MVVPDTLSTYNISGIVLSTSCVVIHLSLTTTLWTRYDSPHFVDRRTESQQV